ncbi:MAG: hypothetical protein K2X25_02555 [Caulobacteraceae bacterium]|nr:hypothetical protein [Caulobacteraceae bacterium]
MKANSERLVSNGFLEPCLEVAELPVLRQGFVTFGPPETGGYVAVRVPLNVVDDHQLGMRSQQSSMSAFRKGDVRRRRKRRLPDPFDGLGCADPVIVPESLGLFAGITSHSTN